MSSASDNTVASNPYSVDSKSRSYCGANHKKHRTVASPTTVCGRTYEFLPAGARRGDDRKVEVLIFGNASDPADGCGIPRGLGVSKIPSA